jgi:hypothetical protein
MFYLSRRRKVQKPARQTQGFRPMLEALEDRTVPSGYSLTVPNNSTQFQDLAVYQKPVDLVTPTTITGSTGGTGGAGVGGVGGCAGDQGGTGGTQAAHGLASLVVIGNQGSGNIGSGNFGFGNSGNNNIEFINFGLHF